LIPNKKGHRSFGSTFVTYYDPNDYFLQPTYLKYHSLFSKSQVLRQTD